jgi:hypothetical protein
MRFRRVAFTDRIGSFFMMVYLLPAVTMGQAIQVEVVRPEVASFETGGSDVAGYELSVDLRIVNGSDQPTSIPDLEAAAKGATWISLAGVQAQGQDGTWRTIFNSDLFIFPEGTQYPACAYLSPHAAADGGHYKSRFAVLTEKLAGLGSHPAIRLNLIFFCRKADGKVITKTWETGPFVISTNGVP